jgi:hypothetical protein
VHFLPPAEVGDFGYAAQLMAAQWNDFVHDQLEMLLADPMLRGHAFFIPTGDRPGREQRLVWDAFPGAIDGWFRHSRAGDRQAGESPRAAAERTAETLVPMTVGFRRVQDGFAPVTIYYRQQDEYCEWRTELDDAKRVQRVTFTAESPEYWAFLESMDPSLRLIAAVYSEILQEAVMPGEVSWPYDVLVPSLAEPSGWAVRFRAHTFDPWNDWNVRRGIVHCTHPDNTLMKAATLMASASILRETPDGRPIDDAFGLICAGGFGDPNRLSDPSIGLFINRQVRLGLEVSLSNPVGVYMSDLALGGFAASAGPLRWRCERGQQNERRMLRAVLEAPDGHLLLDGEPMRHGGEVARRLRMTSSAVLRERPHGAPAPRSAPPVAQCFTQPGRPEYYGVFFNELDWPRPWGTDRADAPDPPVTALPRVAVTAPAFGPTRPVAPTGQGARLDGRTLRDIADEGALDSRWSHWSRWSRWSMLGDPFTPSRWSGTN